MVYIVIVQNELKAFSTKSRASEYADWVYENYSILPVIHERRLDVFQEGK